jgi:phosphatidylserine decarboxylase
MRDGDLERIYRDGRYITLRLTSGMYHRFHAPHDCVVEQVDYISGDTWNVNPIALKRIEKLFCKNERAVIRTRLAASGHLVTLVPVAAILVAGIRLHFLDVVLKRRGPNQFLLRATLRKGQEMGWFEHGSTIIVFAPDGFDLCASVSEGAVIRMGQPLMRLPIPAD